MIFDKRRNDPVKKKNLILKLYIVQEYNNTNSYPDSVRAAKIKVSNVGRGVCDYLYGRDVDRTGKFCAGGAVDACQEDSGGPLVCSSKGRYTLVGIISSGKG